MTKKDFKLYGSLILYALLPSVYLLIRMQIVAVSGVDINIMGQIEWFDLIDEVLVTALTVPLYFLLKPDKEKTAPDKNCAAFLASFAVYTVFTIIVMMKIGCIAKFMNAENPLQKYNRPYAWSIVNRIFLDIKHSALCIQIVHAFPFLFCYPYILCLSLLLPSKNI